MTMDNAFFKMLAIALLLMLSAQLQAADSKLNEVEPPKVGNFSLRGSQQPGPLVGIGTNLLDKDQAQAYLFADDYVGKRRYNIDLVPSLVYQWTDDLSINFNYPVAVRFKEGKAHSSGPEDMFIQLEYGYYSYSNADYSDQATVLGNMTFPTGSTEKNPATGIGASSFLFGMTFMRTYPDWLFYGSPGLVMSATHGGVKSGNQYIYQCGVGRNIKSVKDEFITSWLVEISGQYSEKTKVHGLSDPDSGGNVIYLVPSIWFSTNSLILQAGAGVAISQNLFGNQTKAKYLFVTNLGWTF